MTRDIEEELDQLRQLRDTGALSDDEYRRAKAVIEGAPAPAPESPSPSPRARRPDEPQPAEKQPGAPRKVVRERGEDAEKVDPARLQAELLRLDQDWQAERERYLAYRKYGAPVEPNWFGMTMRLVAGLIALGVGLWFAQKGATNKVGIGVLLIFFGVWVPLSYGRRLAAFLKAEQEYQARRRRVSGRLSDLED